jgi:hypothetical protein
MSPVSWWGFPPPHLYTRTEMSASAVPSLCLRDALHVTHFLVGVSSSSPIHKYRIISLRCAQPLLQGLLPCHPFPSKGVLLLPYTQVQKCQPQLCPASARATHYMSPFSWWGCPPPHLYTSTEMSASALPSLCSRDSLHVTRFLVWVCPPPYLYTSTEMLASALPSFCSRDSLHVTRFLVGVSSSSPIHKYRNVSLRCAQPLLKRLAPCHPFPGGDVLLLTSSTKK